MTTEARDAFVVEWPSPEMAAATWTYDSVHFPSPLPALSQHIARVAVRNLMGSDTLFLRGYPFFRDYFLPPPSPELMARGPKQVWSNEYLPLVKQISARMRERDYDALSARDLWQQLDTYIGEMTEAFNYTLVVMLGFILPTVAMVQFCEEELGPEGATLAATLLQGFKNETSRAAGELGELAALAATLPEVAACLRDGRYADISTAAGGGEFMERFASFIEQYGGRAETWGQPEIPTWGEEPEKPLSLVARYLQDPETSPAVAMSRSAAQREMAAARIEARLPESKREQFQGMLAAASGHVDISEERARWQLIVVGNLRLPILALGRKLAAAGNLAAANDIFHLTDAEIEEAIANPGRSFQAAVEASKRAIAADSLLTPPPFVGTPPDPALLPPEMQAFMTYFFGAGPPQLAERTISGRAASQGKARGTARVVRELKDAGRVARGDILVCQTTSPPWTPLFAMCAAVVTDTGGILSHSAICAREYGIPAVVGTQVATRLIPDGAIISVDGDSGTVTIESQSGKDRP